MTNRITITAEDLSHPSNNVCPAKNPHLIFSLEQEKRMGTVDGLMVAGCERRVLLANKRKSALFNSNPVPFNLTKMSSVINKMQPANEWTNYKWTAKDSTVFPSCMTDFAQMTFKQVYETDKKYVEFMRTIKEATGLFKAFQQYIELREIS